MGLLPALAATHRYGFQRGSVDRRALVAYHHGPLLLLLLFECAATGRRRPCNARSCAGFRDRRSCRHAVSVTEHLQRALGLGEHVQRGVALGGNLSQQHRRERRARGTVAQPQCLELRRQAAHLLLGVNAGGALEVHVAQRV